MPNTHPEAANVLRGNRDIVRALEDAPGRQMLLFGGLEPSTLHPDTGQFGRAVLQNARGHASHELGEPLGDEPSRMSFMPLLSMSSGAGEAFERAAGGVDLRPEVGSRMTLRSVNGEGLAGGWVEGEECRHRYAVDWSSGITVGTVIREYLATETVWTS